MLLSLLVRSIKFSNTLAHIIGSKEVSDAFVVKGNALIQFTKFFTHIANQLRQHVSEVVVSSIGNLPERMSEARDVAAKYVVGGIPAREIGSRNADKGQHD